MSEIQNQKKDYKKKIGKIFFGMIFTGVVFSFIAGDIWQYIGDGQGNPVIATVGKSELTALDISQERDNIVTQMQGLPPELVAMQNPLQKALERLIERQSVSEYASLIGLYAPKQKIAELIETVDFFKDPVTREFSHARYKAFLKNRRITEEDFLKDVGHDILRQMIADTLLSDTVLPQDMITFLADYIGEKRSFDYAVLSEKTVKSLPMIPQDDKVLKAYFEKHKERFVRPETRRVSYLEFSKTNLASLLEPSTKDMKTYYDKHLDNYSVPEKRNVSQIIFPDKQKAEEVYPKIESGSDFLASVGDLGYEAEDIQLGVVTTKDFSPDIAKVIFGLKTGEVSKIIQNDFGYAVYFVEDIVPKEQKDFASVKQEIKDRLIQDAFVVFVNDTIDVIEDDRAGGASLAELAKKYKVPLVSFENVMDNGTLYGAEDKPVIQDKKLLEQFFINNIGDDIPVIDMAEGGFIIANINSVQKERALTFAEAKSDVIKQHRYNVITDDLKKKAENILASVRQGKSLEAELDALGVSLKRETLTRRESGTDLSGAVIGDIFKLSVGDILKNEDDKIILAQLKKIEPAKPDAKTLMSIKDKASDDIRYEIYQKFLTQIRPIVGVNVDMSAYSALAKRYETK